MRSKSYSFAALISILIFSISYAGQFAGGLVNNSQKIFAIQLLASRDKSLANEIVKTLKDRSFPAYLTETEKDETTWYRVRVGPFKNRQDAASTLSLAKTLFSDAYIVKEKYENIEYLSKSERKIEKKSLSHKQQKLQTTEVKNNYTNRPVKTQPIEKTKYAIGQLVDAVYAGNVILVTQLLDQGGNPDTTDRNGRTILMAAAREGHTDVVQLLVARNADINASVKYGTTALMLAAQDGHTDIVELLLDGGARMDMTEKNGFDALLFAASRGHEHIVKQLLTKGAKPTTRNQKGETALYSAASHGHTSIVQMLLEHGAEIDARNKLGLTPLITAAINDHSDTVKLLIEKGASVNAVSDTGNSSLSSVALNGNIEIANLLLSNGAEVNHREKTYGATPLLFAIQSGKTDMVRLLLDTGADPNAKDTESDSPLKLARILKKPAMVELLKKAGAKEPTGVGRPDMQGKTSTSNSKRFTIDSVYRKAVKEWGQKNLFTGKTEEEVYQYVKKYEMHYLYVGFLEMFPSSAHKEEIEGLLRNFYVFETAQRTIISIKEFTEKYNFDGVERMYRWGDGYSAIAIGDNGERIFKGQMCIGNLQFLSGGFTPRPGGLEWIEFLAGTKFIYPSYKSRPQETKD